MCSAKPNTYKAKVTNVILGDHGYYAVAVSEKVKGPITFALYKPTWNEEGPRPSPGTLVILEDIRRKPKGWRAEKAKCLRPEDPEGGDISES